jgi:hypothetical protein
MKVTEIEDILQSELSLLQIYRRNICNFWIHHVSCIHLLQTNERACSLPDLLTRLNEKFDILPSSSAMPLSVPLSACNNYRTTEQIFMTFYFDILY